MNWLDKLKGKIGRPDGLAVAQGAETLQKPPDREAGGTVVRAGAKPGTTIAKPGVRFQPNHEVTADLQIKTLLGSGGMGEVYLARQRQWDVDVAVKVPSDEIVSDPENRHRIVREAEAWTDLGLHPNIAYCYYAQPLGELLLLVIEYVDGGNLRDWIASGRCADLKTGLDLAIQFCHGLEHAHKKGLVHRDIKPENVLLMKDGTLKITDFGIVRKALASPQALESSGEVRGVAAGMTIAGIGTPDYMAPEQWEPQSKIDPRADIFAFGICLYEMLCGARPYLITAGPRQEAPDPGRLRGGKGLPERLCRLMKGCVDWDRDQRPLGAREVRAELCAVYEEESGQLCLHAELPELTTMADDWNNRALSYLALGKVQDAMKAWQTALEADVCHVESTYNQGLQRWRRAEATDEEILTLIGVLAESDETSWLPRYLLAQVHLERGDAVAARAELTNIRGDGAARTEVAAAWRAAEELAAPSRLLRTFEGHKGLVWSVCLSGDGRYALSGSEDQTLKLWEVSSGLCLRTFGGHKECVWSACLSGDGRYALSGSWDKTLRLWDVSSGRCLRTFEGHTASVWSVCLSGNGQYALSGSMDQTLKLWEVSSGRCLRTFEGHTAIVRSVCLSGDGQCALSGSDDETLKLWEMSSGRCLNTFKGHTDAVISVALSADRQHALSGSDDKTLKLWEVPSGRCLRTFVGHVHYVNSVGLSEDGQYALSGSRDQTLKLWEVSSGRCLRTLEGHIAYVLSVSLSGDGHLALSGSGDGTLKSWEIGTFPHKAGLRLSQAVGSAEVVMEVARYKAALSNAHRAIAAGETAEACRELRGARQLLHHRRAASALREWAKLYARVRRGGLADCWPCWRVGQSVPMMVGSCLSGDGQHALTGSWDKKVKLWEVSSGLCLRTFDGHSDIVNSVSLSGDGRYALSGSRDQTLKLWEASSGRCLRTFHGHCGEVSCVVLSEDGQYALSGSDDKSLTLWEVPSGRCLRTHTALVTSISLSGDGQYALSGGLDDTLKFWEVSSGRCLRTFGRTNGHAGTIRCVSLSGDGRYALSGSNDKTLKLWEVPSRRCLRTFEGHTSTVMSVSLSRDGRHALSGSQDKTVKLWDLSNGRCIHTFKGHTADVISVSLSQDGQHLLVGCADGSITLWFLDWELEEDQPANWDEGARLHLEMFLRAHRPYGFNLPQNRQPTDEEVTRALTRQGRPEWSEQDFRSFLYTLGCAGYGWLRPEGVRRELERMAAIME